MITNQLKINLYLYDITVYPHWTSGLENGLMDWSSNLLARRGHYGYSLAIVCTSVVHSLLQCIMGWKSTLANIHYGFGHHYEWLYRQIVPYLRVIGRFRTQPNSAKTPWKHFSYCIATSHNPLATKPVRTLYSSNWTETPKKHLSISTVFSS